MMSGEIRRTWLPNDHASGLAPSIRLFNRATIAMKIRYNHLQ